jgi:hypothetical protein
VRAAEVILIIVGVVGAILSWDALAAGGGWRRYPTTVVDGE